MKKWITQNGYEITPVLSEIGVVYLVKKGKTNLLVDTSVSRSWKKLERKLDRLGIRTIDYLVLTHAHYDHAANARRIREKYGAKIILQQEEESYLRKGENILPKGTYALVRPLVNWFGKPFIRTKNYDPCQPDILVKEEFDLKDQDFEARLIHTPGHTQGSMSLIIDEEIALVGDAMFGILPGSVFPPLAQDEDLMIKSWGKLLETPCRLFIPAHGTADTREMLLKDYQKRKGNTEQV